jgi:hypothetical protein
MIPQLVLLDARTRVRAWVFLAVLLTALGVALVVILGVDKRESQEHLTRRQFLSGGVGGLLGGLTVSHYALHLDIWTTTHGL